MIDLSCVRAASTLDEIQEMAKIAMQYGCICTFALPAHTPLLIDLLKHRDDILIATLNASDTSYTDTTNTNITFFND